MRVNLSKHGITMEVTNVLCDDMGEVTKACGLAVAANVDEKIMDIISDKVNMPKKTIERYVELYKRGIISKDELKSNLHITPDVFLNIHENGTIEVVNGTIEIVNGLIEVVMDDPKKPSFYLEEE